MSATALAITPAAASVAGSAGASLRALRAAAFAAVSVVLGLVAHLLAGGSVSVACLLMAWGVSFVPAHLLAGRERSLAVIVAALGAAQAALHLLFSSAHAVEAPAGHAHAHSGLVPDIGMLTMHAWAVVLTAVWLSRGEAAVWAVLRRLAVRLLIAIFAVAVPTACAVIAPPARRPVILRSILLGHEMGRRGPPRSCAFFASV
ncbi:MFS transporter [Nonomuraea polychroma]|uniref:MFS transporter n=1 Tax=Nonomuraea polychroma TaxID=46176 RepID=UPI003D8C62A5